MFNPGLQRNKVTAEERGRRWTPLPLIVLPLPCRLRFIAGVETMFADLGHFSACSIKTAFTFLVYPCLVLAYMGEAAFLSCHNEDIQRSFYKAIPEPIFWPVFIVATFAAVVEPVFGLERARYEEDDTHSKRGVLLLYRARWATDRRRVIILYFRTCNIC
ncbi:probable potassium transporter 13 isoform X2 [Spinacia oleracea]|uniref:Probable potassium transporter 13 isoform X2 n=1 Tax=Spinacia oleracea TaxID=3562 RepID=A0ABM3R9U6_SPIOL|nr:probable potassium transporter 13 isoform X2 [Spinacia oleracea]